ncbi:hypothetical protein [Planktothrix agardhii]|jgi:hypothetical protein|uniref:hypothetical protein n=1 Tax=Planktothrix agardhii TaxID=1160 RepID=UPI0028A8EF5A|nr:hypothetical protein [Planktothrix agardhii]
MNDVKMTPEQQNLYVQICQFELDQPSAYLPFSAKLAWEYQWTGIYTYRILDYSSAKDFTNFSNFSISIYSS